MTWVRYVLWLQWCRRQLTWGSQSFAVPTPSERRQDLATQWPPVKVQKIYTKSTFVHIKAWMTFLKSQSLPEFQDELFDDFMEAWKVNMVLPLLTSRHVNWQRFKALDSNMVSISVFTFSGRILKEEFGLAANYSLCHNQKCVKKKCPIRNPLPDSPWIVASPAQCFCHGYLYKHCAHMPCLRA